MDRGGTRGRTLAWLVAGTLLGAPAVAWAPPLCSVDTDATDSLVLRVSAATVDGVPVDVVDREYELDSFCEEGVVSTRLADPDAVDGQRTGGFRRRP